MFLNMKNTPIILFLQLLNFFFFFCILGRLNVYVLYKQIYLIIVKLAFSD
jgi:hypothetical protein